jgi:hypothetical protein
MVTTVLALAIVKTMNSACGHPRASAPAIIASSAVRSSSMLSRCV